MSDYYNPAGPSSTAKPNTPGEQYVPTTKGEGATPEPKKEPVGAPPQSDFKPKAMPETLRKATAPPTPKEEGARPLEAAKSAPDAEGSYNAFVEALIVDLGFDKAGEQEKVKLAEAIKRRVEARVLRVLMSSLTDEQRAELDKEVAEKGLQEEAIIKLLSEKAPDASNAILSALEDLYTEMKEETNMLWEAAAAKTASEKAEKAPTDK